MILPPVKNLITKTGFNMKNIKTFSISLLLIMGMNTVSEAQTWGTNSGNFYANPTTTRLGIGTNNPNSKLHINAASGEDALRIQLLGSTRMILHNNGGLGIGNFATPPARGLYVYGQAAIGTTSPISWAQLDIYKSSSPAYIRLRSNGDNWTYSGINFSSDETTDKEWEILHRKASPDQNSLLFSYYDGTTWNNNLAIKANGDVGIGDNTPTAKLDVNGTTKTKVLEITGGSDLAESFEINSIAKPLPGMLVSIDPDNPGELTLSTSEYDRKVAGIVSGANNISTGLLLNQKGTITDGEFPVALTGRVYCYVDATENEVTPGDLLTTSSTPGYAMKAIDYTRANGSSIGKAMTSLEKGEKGLVLVLVTLK